MANLVLRWGGGVEQKNDAHWPVMKIRGKKALRGVRALWAVAAALSLLFFFFFFFVFFLFLNKRKKKRVACFFAEGG